jgi:CubicO group peptidase (beta-lactamase class C family)
MRLIVKSTGILLFLVTLVSATAAETPRAKPDDVGISSQRLQRIHGLIQRHIDLGSFSGAVTLVARNGRLAHLEAQGLMDIETKKPMATDAMFRIMSMTKPVVGVSVLMLVEEGKVRLNDPISKFIPQFKELKVGVLQGTQPPPAPAGQRGAPPRFYTVPPEREITIKDLLSHTSGLVSGPISNSENAKVSLKGIERRLHSTSGTGPP